MCINMDRYNKLIYENKHGSINQHTNCSYNLISIFKEKKTSTVVITKSDWIHLYWAHGLLGLVKRRVWMNWIVD